MRVPLLVLNYNGRRLLEECLPSLAKAAAASRHDCRVVVIDNSSTDDSLDYLRSAWPEMQIIEQPNRGLCSYNAVLADMDAAGQDGPVAVLLNNDIKLAEDCVDALIEPLLDPPQDSTDDEFAPYDPRETNACCWMTSALCWRFDGSTYDGQKTAVRWRHGLVQATSMFPGHQAGIHEAGWTASAGAAIAVRRRTFLELRGFDPLFLPGRLEDLDLSFRAWQAGYHARHVPAAVAWHLGMGSFSRAFSEAACDLLTLRNTLLFQAKNLRHPAHMGRQLAGLPLRLARELLLAPIKPASTRWTLCRALLSAWQSRKQLAAHSRPAGTIADEAEFFHRFHASQMQAPAASPASNSLQARVTISHQQANHRQHSHAQAAAMESPPTEQLHK
ncbi:MAG: glycosyltransferase family 2 protein [Pirellulales bacterium]